MTEFQVDHEVTLSDDERAALSRAIVERGHGEVAIAASVHRLTVTRALAGLPVRRGSAALIRAVLARWK